MEDDSIGEEGAWEERRDVVTSLDVGER